MAPSRARLCHGVRELWRNIVSVATSAGVRCSSASVVFAYDRNTYTNALLRKKGIEVITITVRNSGAGATAGIAWRARSSVMRRTTKSKSRWHDECRAR